MEYFPSHIFCYVLHSTRKEVEWHLQFSPTSGNVRFYESLLWLVETIFRFNGMIRTIIDHSTEYGLKWNRVHLYVDPNCSRPCYDLDFIHNWCSYVKRCSLKYGILIIIPIGIGSIDFCVGDFPQILWNWNSHNRSIKGMNRIIRSFFINLSHEIC